MLDFKVVYLIVERGLPPNHQTFWRIAGTAYVCRDGSLNLKLDIHPGLRFNIRDPKSNGELRDALHDAPSSPSTSTINEDDIPF